MRSLRPGREADSTKAAMSASACGVLNARYSAARL